MKKITILIPCYNEEEGIGKVIDGMPIRRLGNLGYITEIIVIDNNSSDRTAKVAEEKGVRIVSEKKQGKGNALKAGLSAISKDTRYVVMLDGDNTYKAKEIPRLVEPLESNFCDVIVGSRLGGKMNHNSMSFSHRVANWLLSFLVRQFYRANITDTLTGFFAWKKNVIDRLSPHLISKGFEVEMEMITKMAKCGYSIYSVPVTYDERMGESNLHSLKDGIKILWMFFKNLTWTPGKQYGKN